MVSETQEVVNKPAKQGVAAERPASRAATRSSTPRPRAEPAERRRQRRKYEEELRAANPARGGGDNRRYPRRAATLRVLEELWDDLVPAFVEADEFRQELPVGWAVIVRGVQADLRAMVRGLARAHLEGADDEEWTGVAAWEIEQRLAGLADAARHVERPSRPLLDAVAPLDRWIRKGDTALAQRIDEAVAATPGVPTGCELPPPTAEEAAALRAVIERVTSRLEVFFALADVVREHGDHLESFSMDPEHAAAWTTLCDDVTEFQADVEAFLLTGRCWFRAACREDLPGAWRCAVRARVQPFVALARHGLQLGEGQAAMSREVAAGVWALGEEFDLASGGIRAWWRAFLQARNAKS